MNFYVDLDDKFGVELIKKALEQRLELPTPMHVYVQNKSMLQWDDLQFGFGNKTSTIFKREHPFDFETYTKIPLKDLHDMLTALQKNEIPASEIIRQHFDYFGDNVVNVGKMMERKEWLSESWSGELRKSAVQDLQSTLSEIGYTRDIYVWLDKKIEQRLPSISHQDNLELEGGEKVGCRFRFDFDSKGTGYSLPAYDMTLFVKTPIEHGVINGIDTAQLEKRMGQLDWHFGIAETPTGMLKGYKEAEAIEDALTQLGKDDKGAKIAMQLWNNHVPPQVLLKPEFIRKAEEQTNIYPKGKFSANTTLKDASDQLKATYLTKQELLGDYVNGHMIHTTKAVVPFTLSDIEKLDQRMKVADWSYDYTEDSRVWQRGFAEIAGIKKDLEKLCQAPGGGIIADELWNKHVPQYTVVKPDFIGKSLSSAAGGDLSHNNSNVSAEKPKPDAATQKALGKEQINEQDEQTASRKTRNMHRLE